MPKDLDFKAFFKSVSIGVLAIIVAPVWFPLLVLGIVGYTVQETLGIRR